MWQKFCESEVKKNNFFPEINRLFAEKMVHSNFVDYKPKNLLEEYKYQQKNSLKQGISWEFNSGWDRKKYYSFT